MTALGLQLKSNGFAAVEVETKKNTKTLKKWGYQESPDINLSLSDDESTKPYIGKLKEFLFDFGFKSNQVVTGFPQEEVFVRTIEVPPMADKDLENYIKHESAQYIPLPLEEVTLGYEKMPVDFSEKEKINVLLVAAKKSTVEKYIRIVKSAGLTPLALEPESLSMARSLGSAGSVPSAELIVEIGFKQTLILLVYKGFVVLTRTVPFGDDFLIKALEQGLSLDTDRAVEYKNTYGLDRDKVEGKVYEVLAPVFSKIVEEIKKSKIFFGTHNSNIPVAKIIVSGNTALMPGILVYMVENFGMEVELANPWSQLDMSGVGSKRDELFAKGPIFSVSVGLALKGEK